METDKDKYSKTTIVHLKHVFYGKYTCIWMPWVPWVPWGVLECHGVISSTGFQPLPFREVMTNRNAPYWVTLISEMDLFLRNGRNGDFFYEMELQNPNLTSNILFSCFNTRVRQ